MPRPTRLSSPLLVVLATAMLLAFVWGAAYQRIAADRRISLAAAERENANLALTLGEQNTRALRDVEEDLRVIARAVEAGRPAQEALAGFDREVVRVVLRADADGNLHAIGAPGRGTANVEDRDYFHWHRDHPGDGVFMGRAVFGRYSHRPTIPVSVRVNGPGGRFDGLIVASVRPDYFSGLYGKPALGPGSSVVLAGTDGFVRASHAQGAGRLPAYLGASTLLQRQKASPSGTFVSAERDGAAARVVSYYTLPDYPGLMIAVSRSEADVLAEHGRRARALLLAYMAVTVVLLLLGGLTLLGIRRGRRHVGALAESEARYRKAAAELAHIIDESLDAICTLDREGRFVHVSAASRAIWGYAPEELVGRQALDFLHPDDRERTLAGMGRVLAGEPTRAFENRHVHRDGHVVHLMWSARWIEEEQAMFCVARDVSEAKLMAQAHQALAERLRETLETLTSGFVTVDRAWRFTYVNREAERIFGRPRESMLAAELWREIPGIVGTPFETAYRRAMRERVPVQLEEFHAPYGKWFEVRVYPASDGGLAIYFHDATGRREALRRLEESERRFERVALSTSDMVWEWEPASGKVWRGGGMKLLEGHTEESFPPGFEGWLGLVHPDERERVRASIAEALASGADRWAAEYRLRRADGTYATVSERASIERDAAGAVVRMVGGMTDVTEQRELERQLMRTQRLESLGTLAGGVAHDLNNVLTPISMGVNLLAQSALSREEREILDSIRLSAIRGSEIVKQVLSFARGMEGQQVEVQPRLVLEELARMIRETFPRNIEIAMRIPGRLPMVRGDPTQIHQVLLNLCVNARDAMPQGGKLLVRARRGYVFHPMAAVGGDVPPGQYVCVDVEDTGTGIDPATLERIFDPFFTTKPHGEGTGLGLSTTLAILRKHDAHVQVHSRVGSGTCFTLLFPACEPPAARLAAQRAAPAARGQGQTVLVVEDEPEIRELARRTLALGGYRVLAAANGQEALDIVRARPRRPDLVVTDMMMPVMDGAALVRALAAIDPALPVIRTSGIPEAEAQAHGAAGTAFLPKPYTAQMLLAAVAESLAAVEDA